MQQPLTQQRRHMLHDFFSAIPLAVAELITGYECVWNPVYAKDGNFDKYNNAAEYPSMHKEMFLRCDSPVEYRPRQHNGWHREELLFCPILLENPVLIEAVHFVCIIDAGLERHLLPRTQLQKPGKGANRSNANLELVPCSGDVRISIPLPMDCFYRSALHIDYEIMCGAVLVLRRILEKSFKYKHTRYSIDQCHFECVDVVPRQYGTSCIQIAFRVEVSAAKVKI